MRGNANICLKFAVALRGELWYDDNQRKGNYGRLVMAALIIIVGISIMGLAFIAMKQNNKDKNRYIENINLFQQEYDEYVNKKGIVKSDMQATLIELNEYDSHSFIPQYLWIENETLKIFPMSKYYIQNCTSSISRPYVSELKLKSIPLDSILYFEEIGELHRYEVAFREKSSLKSVLFGEAVFDASGEVVGIREPMRTRIITEDKRRIELVYKNTKNKSETLVFKHDAYEVLKKLIPLKELHK